MLRLRTIAVIAVLAAGLAGGLGYVLVSAQERAESTLVRNFESRTRFAAKTTSDIMGGSAKQSIQLTRSLFGGPRATLAKGLAKWEASGPVVDQLFVLDARGRVLIAKPAVRGGLRALLRRNPLLRRALAGQSVNSDVIKGPGGKPMFQQAIPFDTPSGRRVFADGAPADLLQSFIAGYLKAGPAVRGARGVLIDGNGRILADSVGATPGTRLKDPELLAAVAQRTSGTIGDRYFTAAPVANSRWRVVFIAPKAALFAPVSGSQKVSWLVFLAFVAALAVSAWLVARIFRNAGKLAAAREREQTARKLAEERLHDSLTGLPNRALFQDRVEHALAGLTRRNSSLAVLFLDLDRFKRVNDSRGHGAGDALLAEVAKRLRSTLRAADTVSRFGGDEFLILCEDIDDPQDALHVARKLQDAVHRPLQIGASEVQLSASVGIVVHGAADRPTTPADLIVAADAAMYRAKERERGSVELFDAELHRCAMERLDIEIGLRQALIEDELVVHYQPVVSPGDGCIRGVEALVRWERPGRGLVPPMEFIPVAEDTGQIVELGAWVLRRATMDVSGWAAEGLLPPGFTVAVNLSARQLSHRALSAEVEGALRASGLPASMLCLEITESAVMDDPERAHETLSELSALGVEIAIDDFGVGHSSLEHIARLLPVSVLKLDRSFVSAMDDERDLAIVATVASLAASLHMAAVAEGVESAEQARCLTDLGYPLAQGFYFARPASAADVRATLRQALPAGSDSRISSL